MMSMCTSSLSKLTVYRKKVGVFVFGVLTMLLVVNIIHYGDNLRHILKVVHRNHTCAFHGNSVKWVNFSSNVFRLFVYNALYDDRPSLLSDPVIRIMAVSDPFENLKSTQLYCILHYDSYASVLLMTEKPKAIGYGWGLNKRSAKEYVYTCPCIKGMIPQAVAISITRDENSTACVPITIPNKPEKKRDFIICPQAAYGLGLDPYRLIEWLELQKLLGVSLVGIYVLSASDSALKVFKHYAAEGFVELREMNYIYSSVNDVDKEFWLHLTPAINDCIYRHMYEFNRIAIMDFDEVIMPRYHNTLSELVTYLDKMQAAKKSAKNINYAFRNNYFFLDLPPDDKISQNLTTLRFRRKVELSPDGYSVKSIIDPLACTHMHNHYCWGLTANYSKYGNTMSVNPHIGLNQHYKNCHFSRETCDTMLRNTTEDDVMLRLSDDLARNVREKNKAIAGHEM